MIRERIEGAVIEKRAAKIKAEIMELPEEFQTAIATATAFGNGMFKPYSMAVFHERIVSRLFDNRTFVLEIESKRHKPRYEIYQFTADYAGVYCIYPNGVQPYESKEEAIETAATTAFEYAV